MADVKALRMQDGYYIFRIDDKVESTQLSFEDSRERIRSYLLRLKGQEKLQDWLKDQRSTTRIQVVMDME